MIFPSIIVERPYQRSGRVWIADSAKDVIDETDDNRYGDGWSVEQFSCAADIEAIWGDDQTDWPLELQRIAGADLPGTLYTSPVGSVFSPGRAEENDLLDFALDYIRHDLYSLDILENRAEAEQLLAGNAHNVPRAELLQAMACLGWVDEEESDDD